MDWYIPVAGVLIGWITNIIAVEMLFNPRKAKYIFGKRVPFTPGLVPQNKAKMLDMASKRVSSVVIDTLSDKGSGESYKIFNKFLDSHWATQLFLGDSGRKKLYNRITNKVIKTPDFKNNLNKLIKAQMDTYSIAELESSVKQISNESLRGIKILGAIIGGLVGLITMLIGGM
tara:strand:+ start:7397 stop:7915 length:519 start_codon:yes stop_codon:yes gene_type:complete